MKPLSFFFLLLLSSAVSADLPLTPAELQTGQTSFNQNCSQCHGVALEGTDFGPPLNHLYYVPSHHSDTAFYRAIYMGVQQHHWAFGNMSKIEGLSPDQAKELVGFVRWAQQTLGLY